MLTRRVCGESSEKIELAKIVRVAEYARRMLKRDFDSPEILLAWCALAILQAECDEDGKAPSRFSECVEACNNSTDIERYEEDVLPSAAHLISEL